MLYNQPLKAWFTSKRYHMTGAGKLVSLAPANLLTKVDIGYDRGCVSISQNYRHDARLES